MSIAASVRLLRMAAALGMLILFGCSDKGSGEESPVGGPAANPPNGGVGAVQTVCLDADHFSATASEAGVAYANAVHVEFRGVPAPLVLAARASMEQGRSCVLSLGSFVESPVRLLRSIAQAPMGRGTIEPSFGCEVIRSAGGLPAPPERDDFLRHWIVRFTPEEVGTPGGEGGHDERLRALSKNFADLRQIVRQAAPVALVQPPDVREPFEGTSAQDDQGDATPCGTQWYLHSTGVATAWASWPDLWRPAAGEGPIVALVDFGFRAHDELDGVLNMDKAHNSCDGSSEVGWGARTYHGTAVAGLLGSRRDGVGIVGVAPGVEVWPIQGVCGARIPGEEWAKAIKWAADRVTPDRRMIILLEVEAAGGWDIEEANLDVRKAITYAVSKDVVVITAAGNGETERSTGRRTGRNTERDRSGLDIEPTGSILVGATSYATKELTDFSNHGARVVVSAPGDGEHDLTVSDRQGIRGYVKKFGGTSGAAPKVAGVVALMLADNDRLKPNEVRAILGSVGGDLVGKDGKPSGKALDASAAIAEARRRRGAS